MTRLLRRLGLGLLALIVLCGVGLAVFVSQISAENVVRSGLAEIPDISGYTVEVGPEPQLTYWPAPGVTVDGLTIKTDTGRQIVEAPEAIIGLSYMSILRGQIAAGSVTLISPEIDLLEEDIDRVLQDPRANAEWGTLTHFAVQQARIDMATSDADPVILEDATIAVDHAGPSEPTTVSGRATMAGLPIEGKAEVETLTALHGGQFASVDLSLQVVEATAAFQGRVRLAVDAYPHVQGKGRLTAPQLGAQMALLDLKLPALPDVSDLESSFEITSLPNRLWLKIRSNGVLNERETALDTTLSADAGWMEKGDLQLDVVNRAGGLYSVYFNGRADRKGLITGALTGAVLDLPGVLAWTGQQPQTTWVRATFASDVSLTQTGVAAQSVEMTLDDTPVRGSIAADMRGDKPVISARVEATGVTLPDLLGDGTVAGWRRAIGDVTDALTVDLSLEDTSYADLPIQRLEATLTQRGGDLGIEASQVDIFGGTAALDVNVPDQADAPLTGAFRAAELNAAAVAKTMGETAFTGTLAGDVTFSVQRKDGARSLSDLSGDLTLTGGTVPLPDLKTAASNRDPGSAMSVELAKAKVSYNVDEISFQQLNLTSSGLTWSGSARIDAGGGTVDGRLVLSGPAEQATEIALQGPVDRIEAVVQARQPSEQFADAVAPTPSSQPSETDSTPAASSGATPEPEDAARDDALGQQAAAGDAETLEAPEPVYTGPAAPETLTSPIPRRAPR